MMPVNSAPHRSAKTITGLRDDGREPLDEDVDADMDAGAHAERRAELRHPHEHVGGELLRPGEVDRGERRGRPSRRRALSQTRPCAFAQVATRHRIAGAVAVHDGDEGDAGRRGDQDADDPFFEPIEECGRAGPLGSSAGRAALLLPPCLRGGPGRGYSSSADVRRPRSTLRARPPSPVGEGQAGQDCGGVKPEAL